MKENVNLPAVANSHNQYVAQQTPASYFQVPTPESDGMQPAVPLSHYLWILRRHRWKISGFIVACALATLIISMRLTPVYEATATIATATGRGPMRRE